MKLIRPTAVTDAILIESNVVETPPAAYAGGTTYDVDDTVSVGSVGDVLAVYTSLLAGNVGHTPASSPLWWVHSGDTYAVYDAGATYGVDDIVIDVVSHREFLSLQASNNGHALTDAAWWLDNGPTNRWRLFDAAIQTQTTNPEEIVFELEADDRIDSIALLNVSAGEISVTMTDPIDGVVYDRTFSMISDSGIADWYAYFFEPIERLSDLVLTDLPPYSGATIRIVLSDPDQTVACGACVIGLAREIGGTQFGATVSIQDYSVKQQDDFGNFTILQRAFAKRADFSLWVESAMVDRLVTLLAEYRAIPIVYVGSPDYGCTAIYGFFRDFSVQISYPAVSGCNLQVEGLT